MRKCDAQPKTYKEAIQLLLNCAVACASPRTNTPQTRRALRNACMEVDKFLSAPEAPADFDFTDPEILVQTYIEHEGDWIDLVSSVNRNAPNRKLTQ